jgi:hypothetical protein
VVDGSIPSRLTNIIKDLFQIAFQTKISGKHRVSSDPMTSVIIMTEENSEVMDQSPADPTLIQSLGYVTLAWSVVDEMLSAALFSLLSIDKFEFTILID